MEQRRAHLKLHFAVVLFGWTAILGALIELPAMSLVFWRMLITALSLLLLVRVVRHFRATPSRLLLAWMGIGLLVAIHWIAFFHSIKLANASVALVCLATTAFFTAVLEPVLNRQVPAWYELLLGALVVPGMVMVVEGIDASLLGGVWVGLFSAFVLALFGVLNKKLVLKGKPMFITLIELGTGALFTGLLLLVSQEDTAIWPSVDDWLYILVLALICTTLGYVLTLDALRQVSAFTANLALNLEPIYGILLAYLLLKEGKDLTPLFYGGVAVILMSIFLHPYLARKCSNTIEHAEK